MRYFFERAATKFPATTVEKWTDLATKFLSERKLKLEDVKTGADAWTVASRCGITDEAYKDREITDAHIQTALARIFPNAKFKDSKRY